MNNLSSLRGAQRRSNPDKPVLCLMGPTATGKTDLAIALADRFPVEIISVDSVMVYKGMDIGSAKPSKAILQAYPHQLIDICLPTETYSAGQFVKDAQRCIESAFSRDKIPLLVGGTMLYFHAIQQGLSALPTQNLAVREQLQQQADKLGWEALHAQLALVDKESAEKIHPHDPQRIMRALEIYQITGQTRSHLQAQSSKALPYEWVNVVLYPEERALLHEKIEKRFLAMLEAGWIDEVKALLDTYPGLREKPAMRAVGYRQILAYIDGLLSLDELKYKGVVATRQLAKRQCTWLKSWPSGHYYDPYSAELVEAVVRDFDLSV